MNPPKCDAENHIQWQIVSAKVVSGTEVACTDRSPVAYGTYTPAIDLMSGSRESGPA
ncbi:MAG: hypothetical protein QF595_10560 [Dehalococcoidia bacterium]|nr:hypothetical protein [Dehalococcoidia bacterium]